MLCSRPPLAGCVILVVAGVALGPATLYAQPSTAEDQAIDAIRGNASAPGASDQARIAQWLESRINTLVASAKRDGAAAFKTFREAVLAQRDDARNSPAFQTALAEQLGGVVAKRFGGGLAERWVAQALAQVLVDFNRVETVDGLVAGLGSTVPAARYLCARGLAKQQTKVAADGAKATVVVAALKQAGLVETDSVVLAHIYLALSHLGPASSVVDPMLAILAKRSLDGGGGRAEVEAFEFFRLADVAGGLSNEQKQSLVKAAAAFLRMDAARYADENATPSDIEAIEQRLQAVEATLLALQIGGGGDIKGAMERGGHAVNRAAIVAQIHRWIGDAKTNTTGALNQQPWGIAVGAP